MLPLHLEACSEQGRSTNHVGPWSTKCGVALDQNYSEFDLLYTQSNKFTIIWDVSSAIFSTSKTSARHYSISVV